MNIIYAGNPLLLLSLTNTRKKADTPVSGPGAALSDSIALSQMPGRALVKYLQTVDDAASDLLRVVEDYATTGKTADGPAFPGELPQGTGSPVTGRDTFIYFPEPGTGGTKTGAGQVVVLQNRLSLSGAVPDAKGEEAIRALVRESGRQLSAAASGIGLKTASIETVPVQDKFMIIGETRDDTPVVSVVRQDMSGRSEPVTQGDVQEGDVQDVIARIKAFVGELVNVQPEKPLSKTGDVAEFASAAAVGPTIPEAGAPPNRIKIVKEMFAAAFSGSADDNVAKNTNVEGVEVTGKGVAAGPVAWGGKLSDSLPGITVRYINPSVPLPDAPAGVDPGALVADRLMSLKELVGAVPEPVLPSEVLSEEDQTAVLKLKESIHEQVPVMVRQALRAASYNYQGVETGAGQGFFGIDIDKDGALRINTATLTGSLSEKKEETVQFIRDFATSFQDRLRYDFNPLAGVYADTRDAAGITETGRKDRAGDDSDEQRTRLEERLNKVELLLRSSYELKDLFVQAISLKQPGALDETDR